MKNFICMFVALLICLLSNYPINLAFAFDGEIIQYDIYDENGELLSFTSEAEVGDTILTKDFEEYQIYEIDGNKCYARYFRTLNWAKPNKAKNTRSTGKDKKLCLYMTHNDESYTPSDGYDSIYGQGGIHDVAKKLQAELEKNGIQVVLDETLHIPHDSSAYSRSAVTAKSLYTKEKPDALFDIHRDGVAKKYYYITNNGQDFSKIRIVVGKSNPNFEENYKFAQQLFATGNQLYPWLFLDVYCGKGHYNQELLKTNLLFEMGTYLIEKELVIDSLDELAEVVTTALYNTTVNEESGDITINGVEDEENVVVNEYIEEKQKVNYNALAMSIAIVIMASISIYAIFLLVGNMKKVKAQSSSSKNKK